MSLFVFIELTDTDGGRRLVSLEHIVSLAEAPRMAWWPVVHGRPAPSPPRPGTSILLPVGAVHVRESVAEILDLIAAACGSRPTRESVL